MSSQEEVEIKAGHPPALRVGGMRIPQRHKGTEDREESAKPLKSTINESEEEEELTVSKRHSKPLVAVSDVVASLHRDYPTDAVKHTFEKPLPTKDPRNCYFTTKPAIIQQPRRDQSKKGQHTRQ